MAKKNKLTPKQKKFADNYVRLGVPGQSYSLAYDQKNMHYANVCAHNLLNNPEKKHVQDYIDSSRRKLEEKYNYNKEALIRDLLDTKAKFLEMIELASRDHLTDRDDLRLSRLTSLLKGSDITRTNDQLAKLMGAYEPDRIEVKQEWTISFGDDDEDDDEETEE